MRRSTWIGAAALLIVFPASGALAQEDGAAVPETGQETGQMAPPAADGAASGADGAAAAAQGGAAAAAAANGDAGAAQDGAAAGAAEDGAAGAEQNGAAVAEEQAPTEAPAPGPSVQPDSDAGQVAQPQRPLRLRRGTAAPADQAWRGLLNPQLDVAERSQIAAEQLAAAELSLARNDFPAAQSSLELSTQTLQAILSEGPGASLATRLGETAARLQLPEGQVMEIDPLVEEVEQLAAVLPAETLTLVRDAKRQLAAGDAVSATRSLLGARNWVMADLGLDAAEEAFAHARAALAELEAGNAGLARNLVQGVPEPIAELRTSAPLVPVRLRLRAAAKEAENRNWAQAEVLLNEAGSELQSLRGDASPVLGRRIDVLSSQLTAMQERFAAGREPTPRRIRQLAASTGGVPAG
ncbi:hypothetical protein [Vulgatibacter sp.]|uniref:hypothetical protein n=1 Tax=Vulgatibacter sp. TaxID=1971226 RepID=UPI003569996B